MYLVTVSHLLISNTHNYYYLKLPYLPFSPNIIIATHSLLRNHKEGSPALLSVISLNS
jgi:hypothetical protein